MSQAASNQETVTGTGWCLYMLECNGGRIYTGITNNMQSRYAAHASGKGARFTRAFPPVRILKVFACADRSAASKAEYAAKRMTAAQKRELSNGGALNKLAALIAA